MSSQAQAYLTFRVGREWYGVHVEKVIEVLHMIALNEIPGAKMLGIMTLRERVIQVADLRQQFGLSSPQYRLDTPIIAVQACNGAIGLVVDEADAVVYVAGDDLTDYSADYVANAFRMDGRLVFVVDIDRMAAEAPGG